MKSFARVIHVRYNPSKRIKSNILSQTNDPRLFIRTDLELFNSFLNHLNHLTMVGSKIHNKNRDFNTVIIKKNIWKAIKMDKVSVTSREYCRIDVSSILFFQAIIKHLTNPWTDRRKKMNLVTRYQPDERMKFIEAFNDPFRAMNL